MAANNLTEAVERVEALKALHKPMMGARDRMRILLNGGPDAIRHLLGNAVREEDLIPAPGLIEIAMERIAQKLRGIPEAKVTPGMKRTKSDPRQAAERIERIVTSYDDAVRLRMMMPQLARWVPGYGFGVLVLREGKDVDGHPYPAAELRNPYDCYPGTWGAEQQPTELAVVRRISPTALGKIYPHARASIDQARQRVGGGVLLPNLQGGWEGSPENENLEVVTYYDEKNQWVILNGSEKALLDITPNLIDEPHFVIPKRYSFDALTGAYDHLYGVLVQFIKMTMLGMIATEDAVFTETNIFGDMVSGDYKKGRFAFNQMEANARVEKPQSNIPQQTWQQIDRTERHFRIGANYPVSDDGQSPNSFATGRGIEELGTAGSLLVAEYKLVFEDAIEHLDRKRLKWDQKMYGGSTKPIMGTHKGDPFAEEYDPEVAISNHYRTRRRYGIVSGVDDPRDVVTLLQLMQGQILDQRTSMEHVDNLGAPVSVVLARLDQDRAKNTLFVGVEALAQQGDPRANAAMVEVLDKPDDIIDILKKYYTPQEPELSPEEEQFVGGGAPEGPPEDFSTVLSRLTQGGEAQGGVQTVGTLPGR